MITFTATGRHATARTDEVITTGSVGIPVEVTLNADFDGLQAIFVFACGDVSVDVALLGQEVTVPPQLVTERGRLLTMGVYATRPDGTIVIPTVWAEVGIVREGTQPSGVDPAEPTPSWAAQVQQWASDAAESAETATETAASIREDMDEFSATSAEVLADARAATVVANAGATNANTAASAANTSATAADAATASAVTATGAANDAASAANAAAALATSAAGVATDAAGNADIATAAARAATADAQTATTNANAAASAASSATTDAMDATVNANQAAQSATAAATNANAATESAIDAASAANAAAITASQGAESANAATDAAIAATQGAQAATTAATTATAAAAQAASTANDAAERAEDAASNANAAASQADAATTAANAATTAATTATSGATQATQAANVAASAASQAASDATESAGMARRASAATWLSGNVPVGSIAEGELLTASDVYAAPPRDVDVYGKSEQEGTPTPDDPQEIKSVDELTLHAGDGTTDATGWPVPIPLQGHHLRSLPDGTRDELRLTYQGPSETEGYGVFGVELVQNVGSVDLGDLSWAYNSQYTAFGVSFPDIKVQSSGNVVRLMCDTYTALGTKPITGIGNMQDHAITQRSTYTAVYIKDKTYTDATDFINAMGDVKIRYPLATPTTIDLGTVDLPVLPAPDLNAWADGGSVRPTIGMGYEQDINIVIANIGAALADLATS